MTCGPLVPEPVKGYGCHVSELVAAGSCVTPCYCWFLRHTLLLLPAAAAGILVVVIYSISYTTLQTINTPLVSLDVANRVLVRKGGAQAA